MPVLESVEKDGKGENIKDICQQSTLSSCQHTIASTLSHRPVYKTHIKRLA